MMLLTIVWAELRRTFHLARSYWLEYVSDFVLYAVGFLMLLVAFYAASDHFGPEECLRSLIGYVTWVVCATIMSAIARVAVEESRTGTLEQLFLSRLHPGLVLLIRTIGFILNYGIRGSLLGIVLAIVLGVFQPVSPLAVLVFMMTIAGACGLGFALAGLALVYKQVEKVVSPIWQMLVFFSGALVPLTHPGLALVAKALPISWGVAGLRAIVLEGATVTSLWQRGELFGLLLNTMFYVVLGAALFTWGQRRARILGVLAHY
jgi:ABC-2 type transport system permease protein